MGKGLLVAAVAALGLFSAGGAAAQPTRSVPRIDWEVRHRFRVVDPADHKRFIDAFNSYVELRAVGSSGRDEVDGLSERYPSPFWPELRTRYLARSSQYDRAWFHDDDRTIDVKLGQRAYRNATCTWRLEETGDRSSGPCRGPQVLKAKLGRNTLSVAVEVGGSMTPHAQAIEIKDIKFVAVGDSFASGEGNPHVTWRAARRAEWWDERCHRSLLASSAQAAILLAQKRKDASVTYVSFACSGATVDGGIVGRYAGVESAQQAFDRMRVGRGDVGLPVDVRQCLPPQLAQVRALLCKRGLDANCPDDALAPIDVLSFTTGGNELNFGKKVLDCAKGRCTLTEADMAGPFSDLVSMYDRLARELSCFPPRQVAAISYPNMTRDRNGNSCNDNPFRWERNFVPTAAAVFGFGITRSEARAAERNVLNPLNRKLQAALKDGWIFVDGYERNYGYCARPTWFHTYSMAQEKQGEIGDAQGEARPPTIDCNSNGELPPLDTTPDVAFKTNGLASGAMHPNVFGHAAMRRRLLDLLEPRLGR